MAFGLVGRQRPEGGRHHGTDSISAHVLRGAGAAPTRPETDNSGLTKQIALEMAAPRLSAGSPRSTIGIAETGIVVATRHSRPDGPRRCPAGGSDDVAHVCKSPPWQLMAELPLLVPTSLFQTIMATRMPYVGPRLSPFMLGSYDSRGSPDGSPVLRHFGPSDNGDGQSPLNFWCEQFAARRAGSAAGHTSAQGPDVAGKNTADCEPLPPPIRDGQRQEPVDPAPVHGPQRVDQGLLQPDLSDRDRPVSKTFDHLPPRVRKMRVRLDALGQVRRKSHGGCRRASVSRNRTAPSFCGRRCLAAADADQCIRLNAPAGRKYVPTARIAARARDRGGRRPSV